MSFDRVEIYHDISLPSSFTYLPTSTLQGETDLSFNRYLQVLFRLDYLGWFSVVKIVTNITGDCLVEKRRYYLVAEKWLRSLVGC